MCYLRRAQCGGPRAVQAVTCLRTWWNVLHGLAEPFNGHLCHPECIVCVHTHAEWKLSCTVEKMPGIMVMESHSSLLTQWWLRISVRVSVTCLKSHHRKEAIDPHLWTPRDHWSLPSMYYCFSNSSERQNHGVEHVKPTLLPLPRASDSVGLE